MLRLPFELDFQFRQTQPDYSTDPGTWGRISGHDRFMDNRGRLFNTTVSKINERFFINFIDPDEPGPCQSDLVQQYLDTFGFDLDGGQILDPLLDLTFFRRAEPQSTTLWRLNRCFVGKRLIPPCHPSERRAPQ